jgi:hypothetical protein
MPRLRGRQLQQLRNQIGNRDNWRCCFCSEPVDRQKEFPHPMSPTLEHHIPIADGGNDEPSNVAIAHLWCNQVDGGKRTAKRYTRFRTSLDDN